MKIKFLMLIALLILSANVFAKAIDIPSSHFLMKLTPVIQSNLCSANSSFLKIYQGSNCKVDVSKLFWTCINEIEKEIPSRITSIERAELISQIISECINAHYRGGDSLQEFRKLDLSSYKARQPNKKQLAIRESIGRLEQIFGGIFVTRHCKFIDETEYAKFEAKAHSIVNLATKVIGQKAVNSQVTRAKTGASSEPYINCGKTSKKFFFASKKFVDDTYDILREK